MNANTSELQRMLCEQWCTDAEVAQDEGGIRLSLPLVEADGDYVTVWLRQELGGWKITDNGTTFMRLSYSMDVDLLNEGSRSKVVERVVGEQGVELHDGELSTVVTEGDLGPGLLRFGQAMLRLSDLKLWSWPRVSSTFYEDLARELARIVGPEKISRDYAVPGVPDANNYRVDFAIKTDTLPLYVFGAPTVDRAKLSTIILLHLLQSNQRFHSIVVPADFEALPKADRSRLVNAANDVVSGIDALEPLERKVRLRMTAS